MPVIVNEVEVIAPPPTQSDQKEKSTENMKPPGPTPNDIYWVTRKLLERRVRLLAR
ncbi:MAG: hypothetical protein WDZ49_12345 [Litorilinea sp.]